MTRPTSNPNGQPSLADLMVRFLANRSDAAAAAVESAGGEVEPHEVAAGFRVDPRTAWTDANAALTTVRPDLKPGAVPAEWAALVGQPAASAVPLATGNFPQRVKDLHPLLAKFDPAGARPSSTPPVPGLGGLRNWAAKEATKSDPAALLLAAGVARAVGDLDRAEELLAAAEAHCTGERRAVWENERAALLWHRGLCEDALAAWDAAAETPAVLFNRGMARLFLGNPVEARDALRQAILGLPEAGGWNALARLYLALAEIHG
jgi:tetratricopeptide (TPR) repeat protein